MSALLQLDHVTIRFGGLTAVSDVSLDVRPGDLAGLIGPNGAGKTTVFNLMTGVYQPTSGTITFDGRPTAKRRPFELTRSGMARTFQNIRLFRSLSVEDNVRAAMQVHRTQGPFQSWWRGAAFRRAEAEVADQAAELLSIFQLEGHRHELATSLSYGDQRSLEIVRALATRPRLLLLDEPAAGMNPTEKVELARLIRAIRDRFQIAILLVEHDMQLVMDLCERIHVLDHGVKIASGTPEEIRRNPEVIQAYLGEEHSIPA
jgi:branched-chain amino acid transport system ATP-binding protein